jgi:hypothetical protein
MPATVVERENNRFNFESQIPDEAIAPTLGKNLQWLSIASAKNAHEVSWLLQQALLRRGLIGAGRKLIFQTRAFDSIIISAAGWDEIERLRAGYQPSRIGFVAMSFLSEFADLFELGLAPGIRAAGFEPLRVDRTEHNNRIDDEIVATIKRSRFVVADFTVNRGGVYFEAGFALGRSLPVIWTVRRDQLDEVHFDNRQYNFIRWEIGEWSDLQNALRNRIEATIGRGPG